MDGWMTLKLKLQACGVVYKYVGTPKQKGGVTCTNCSWCYIGETGRAFNTQKKEHLRNTKIAAKGSKIS